MRTEFRYVCAMPSLTPARPTVEIDGVAVPALDAALVAMEIVEPSSGPFRCTARFANWGASGNAVGFLHFDRKTLEFGRRLTVRRGDDVLFTGRISALEAHFPEGALPEFAVVARDRLHDLRTTPRTRTFTNVSDGDIARQIAGEHGLQAHVELEGPTHRVLAQLDQSDLAFLRDRARAVGGEVWVEGEALHVRTRAARRGDALVLELGATLRSCTAVADLEEQRTSVAVRGWDPARKAAVSAQADGQAIAGEVQGGESGPAVLAAAFGPAVDRVLRSGAASTDEALALAQAAFRARARRFVSVRAVADHDVRLRSGAVVDLRGVGPLFEGLYDVVAVSHRFDSMVGLRTQITAQRPFIGLPQEAFS
jgi:phage protein D